MHNAFKIFLSLSVVSSAGYAVGIYAGGGLAAYGDLVSRAYFLGIPFESHEPLGSSFWVGGGVAVPVWEYAGPVAPGLELATDAGFSIKSKVGEPDGGFDGVELSWKAVTVKENLIFGLAAGPGRLFKPFVGFGGGVAVVPWEMKDAASGTVADSHTEVKAAFGIPFGCEFRVAPHFVVGAKAEYLIITGETTPMLDNEEVDTFMPNLFLVTGVVRADI